MHQRARPGGGELPPLEAVRYLIARGEHALVRGKRERLEPFRRRGNGAIRT